MTEPRFEVGARVIFPIRTAQWVGDEPVFERRLVRGTVMDVTEVEGSGFCYEVTADDRLDRQVFLVGESGLERVSAVDLLAEQAPRGDGR